MSRQWNGEALVNELSSLLGDTSAIYKTRVLGWLNDTIFDISSRHDWGHHLVKGKKLLALGEEIHSLEIAPPVCAKVALTIGGNLSPQGAYSVLFTFVQDNNIETVAGASSSTITATDDNKTISITEIPTSDESLVTKRNVYLKKDDGKFYFHSQIADNFTTTYTITTETSSVIEPPDYEAIRRLKGSPFFEDGVRSNYLEYRDIDQLRKLAQGVWAKGNPEYFSPIESNSITVYPVPSVDMEVSFNYYRTPFRLYNISSSQPDLPIYLKPALKAGVIALGYEYRDRAGQELKRANYENALVDAINRGGRVANIEYVVRDVYGNFNGIEVG
jgi:hypothetical protein